MKIYLTWPGVILVIISFLQLFLFLPFVFLGEWDDARRYSMPLAALLCGWWLRGWHGDARRKHISTKGHL